MCRSLGSGLEDHLRLEIPGHKTLPLHPRGEWLTPQCQTQDLHTHPSRCMFITHTQSQLCIMWGCYTLCVCKYAQMHTGDMQV